MNVIPFIYETKDELLSNTYVVIDNKECIVIDPSSNYDGIINYINKNNLKLRAILITHAHFDHIGGVDRLVNAFHVNVYASVEEISSFTSPKLNCSEDYSFKGVVVESDITSIFDQEILQILDEEIKVIATPYHTRGSVCYYFPKSKLLFSGDSLFMYALGRTDLPTSVPSKRKESIEKLFKLDDDVKVYPGHGRFTSIGHEKEYYKRHVI